MPDLKDGETYQMQGSGAKPYIIKNVGGAYSCTCPAWRNQSHPPQRRTCKHIRALRGDDAEAARLLSIPLPVAVTPGPKATAPGLLLAHSWENDSDLSGWWMSEKLDGVRAYWDGKQFWSRQGNVFHAPDWFVAGLPNDPLDGELWIDRKRFQRTVSVVKRQDKSDDWKAIKYVVFDAPSVDEPFEKRVEFVEQTLGRHRPTYAAAHGHERCRDLDHLRRQLTTIEALGGEGLMLRQPGSKYVAGRSATLLKVKTFHDAEARVIGHLPGKGRHKGRLGALDVVLADGTRFSVGTGFSDTERGNPPPVGCAIVFRYQELSDGGVPRFPSFVRVRTDVTT